MMGQQRSTTHPILEPFYALLMNLKLKVGQGWAGLGEGRG